MSKPTFGLLTPHPQKSGEYLRTLHEWGELPEVVPLPNLANLLAALCNQNEAALLKVLSSAVMNQEVKFYGQSHHGGWVPDMVRVWHAATGKPRIKPATDTKEAQYTQAFNPSGRLHVEAMGMRPHDAVALLVKRGRKIPEELRPFLPQNDESKPQPAPTPATPQLVQEVGIAFDYRALATPEELISAFGNFTGMDASWFTSIKDKPALRAARKKPGTGGRNPTPPLFCPYEVMLWLVDEGRKTGTSIQPETGWRILKNHFPRAYEPRAIGDPNDVD